MSTLALTALLCNLSLGQDVEFLRVAKAIMRIESGGDPYAVGDGGQALGPYQIHRNYWLDATRLLGVDWPYSDARDPVKALAVVRAYTKHYCRAAGVPWNAENMAKIHNGGPTGWKKASTRGYWHRVRQALSSTAGR